jgi:hypothetical protein
MRMLAMITWLPVEKPRCSQHMPGIELLWVWLLNFAAKPHPGPLQPSLIGRTLGLGVPFAAKNGAASVMHCEVPWNRGFLFKITGQM